MKLSNDEKVSLSEFYSLRSKADQVMEYIDGVIYMSPSPSTMHQRISGRLYVQLFHLLEGKECEVFHAPFDIELQHTKIDENKIVVPDLSVVCDKAGLGVNGYKGVPTLIIEILSPSNQSHDLVTKLNLYMEYGIKEYWIVNPLINAIQLYVLDDNGNYQQKDVLKEEGTIHSQVLNGFKVDIANIFKE